ncbi:signal peptidase I [Nocardioides sp.]|uniref:signal peptidase I n=1 Tax=Nocardioides sp. TaxID=35761 RepID=UPI0026060C84|nr:signal peptidase I [Nocardioides sp.]
MARQLVRAVSWVVLLGATALVTLAVLVPRVAGATPYTVLTGSMSPAYPAGTLVVVRPVALADVRVGDVVTYQLRSGEPTVATHRVVGVGWTADGEKVLTTRGDANSVADAEPVREVQLRGEVWYSLPWVGRLNVLLSPDQHQLLVQLAAGGLFLYAAVLLLRGWRSDPGHTPARHPAEHGLPHVSSLRARGLLVTPPGRHVGSQHDESDAAPATAAASEEVSA